MLKSLVQWYLLATKHTLIYPERRMSNPNSMIEGKINGTLQIDVDAKCFCGLDELNMNVF